MTASTSVMEAGGFYAAADTLYNNVDASSVSVGHPAQRGMWLGVESLACATMLQHPSTMDDVLLQLAVAATWMDAVADTFDDDSGFAPVAKAVKVTLERAALFHNREFGMADGPCTPFVGHLIAELIRCGAELEQPNVYQPDRRITWGEARQNLRDATAAYEAVQGGDAADAAVEAEGIALDYLIEQVPAPDGCALAEKIVIAMERCAPFDGALFADHAAAILADARRLAGVA